MWNFSRKRQTAGNICLVLFTAFIFTILVVPYAMVDTAEAALVSTGNPEVTAYEDNVNNTTNYDILIQLAVSNPLTSFDTLRVDFLDADGNVVSVYSGDFTRVYVTDSIYGAVYSLAYNLPSTFSMPVNYQVYGTVYVGDSPLYDVIFTLEPPPPPGGGGGGGTTPDTDGVEKPASDFIGDDAEEVSITDGDVTFVVPAGALDVPALADLLKADPNTKVTFTVKEVTPADVKLADKMGKPEFANLKAVGKVFDFEITAKSGDKEIKITDFGSKLKVAIPYTDADVSGLKEESLGAYRITVNGLVFLGGEVDEEKNLVWFETESFSNYTLMVKVAAFADIMGHWAKNDIELLVDKDIVKGTSDNKFTPDANITRAQFATLLVKALGLAQVSSANTFGDVKSGAWYYGAVETAAANGLAKGFNGNFRPEGQITRQEMAAMVNNALKVGGKTVSVTPDEAGQLLAKFNDQQFVADWAKDSVAVAVKEGIVTGRTASTFVPKANATRAEGTVMIKKVLDSLGKL